MVTMVTVTECHVERMMRLRHKRNSTDAPRRTRPVYRLNQPRANITQQVSASEGAAGDVKFRMSVDECVGGSGGRGMHTRRHLHKTAQSNEHVTTWHVLTTRI
jgi:hypothetical protein